jgi:hypothetical protein
MNLNESDILLPEWCGDISETIRSHQEEYRWQSARGLGRTLAALMVSAFSRL